MADPNQEETEILLDKQEALVLVATASTGQLVVMKLEASSLEYGVLPLRIHLVGVIKSLVVVDSEASSETSADAAATVFN